MHLAAQEGQIDVCQALLDLNADPFAKDMASSHYYSSSQSPKKD